MNFGRRFAALVAGLIVLGPASADAITFPRFGRAAKPAPPAANVWAHEASDLKPDPVVRFGRLDNGLRYAVVRNTTPKGAASVRLRFAAGSMNEAEAERGIAHFLEHMAFNGSNKVPEGEMIKILQRHGLAFGADTNASTSWNETIYQLDLPSTDDETVDTALMLMRETASELTLDPDAIDRERGVVLSEERTRNTPGLRIYQQSLDFLLRGQPAASRMPIGDVEVLRTAKRDRFADFYARNYRPERAVLVVAGDFDPTAMEAKIRARFADWQAKAEAGPPPDYGRPGRRAAEARIVVEPGSPLSIQVAWIRPLVEEPDTAANRRTALVRDLAFAILNRRFERLSRSTEPPFIGAGAYGDERLRSAEITTLGVSAEPARWREALEAAVREQHRLTQFGVRSDELEREVVEMRAGLRAQAAQTATRRSRDLADALIDAAGDREVFTSPADDLQLFEQIVKTIKPREVSAAARDAFRGEGPLIFAATPAPLDGGETGALESYHRAVNGKVRALAGETRKDWPYADFGPAGKVAERTEIDDLGVTGVRFENGVRLLVKPTKFRDEQILIRVRIGDGLLDLPRDRVTAVWAAQGAFTEGGLKALKAEEIEQALSSAIYSAQFSAGEDAFHLQGRTRPEDFAVQMQLLTAYAVAPAYRSEAFQRMRLYLSTLHNQLEATPQSVMGRDLSGIVHGGDARYAFPSRDQVIQAKAEDFTSLMGPLIADGEIEVTVVGDLPADKAIEITAATFGALPPRKATPPPADSRQIQMPSPGPDPVVLRHKGRPDQAAGYIAWRTNDFFADTQQARILRVLAEVMENRLVEEVRERTGDTYSPQANAVSSLTFPGFGYVAAAVEMKPERLDAFFAAASQIAADLRAAPPSADELERARKPLLEGLGKARETNEYWLEQLSGLNNEPRRLAAIRSVESSIANVSGPDIQHAAQAYLGDGKAWRLVVTPN